MDLVFADWLEVFDEARQIAIMATGDGDRVGHTAGIELSQRERAHFDGMVNQFIVVFRPVQPETVRLGGTVFAFGH